MPSLWVIVIYSMLMMAIKLSCGSAVPPVPDPDADATSPATPEAAWCAAILFAEILEFWRA